MSLYQALQLSPYELKHQMREGNAQKKNYYLMVLFLRSFLMILFSIAFIVGCTTIFGQEQSSLAVVLLCLLLSLRVVDFGYNVKESIIGLGVVFLVFLIVPQVVGLFQPVIAFIIHFLALILIFFITSYNRLYGNPGLYSFSYMFLVGTVPPPTVFSARLTLMIVMYLLFSLIYYKKHREKHQEHTFRSRMLGENIFNENNRFLLLLAFGMSAFFFVMAIYPLERFMWAGFACSSLLAGNHDQLKERSIARVIGAVCGSLLFLLVMKFLPANYWFFIGPIAGFFLGLSTNYRNQTIINCFGALLLAQGIYGIQEAAHLRIFTNLFGVVFGVIYLLFMNQTIQYLTNRRIPRSSE